MRRHWYLVLSGLVATACLCIAATSFIPPSYQAEASVLLLPPRSSEGGGENQYLNLGGLQPTADTVARAMTDSDVQADLEQAGAAGEYVIQTDPTTNGPVLLVTVTDVSPAATLSTLKLVLAQVPEVLTDLQAKISVPTKARLGSTVIAEDRAAELVLKSRIRVLAAAAGLGLAITFGGVVFFDSRARQRAATRRRGSGQAGRRGTRGANGTPVANGVKAPRPVGAPVAKPEPAQPAHPGQQATIDLEHAETVRLST